jgi:protein-S-isoprenylcysteine O-methyltransferase Ste14
MFPPLFPLYIPALAALSRYGTLIWLGGVSGLWLTRYTHQAAQRWGPAYYVVSAFLRPAGILLIMVGWLALYSPESASFGVPLGWVPGGDWAGVVCWAAILLFFGLGVWSVATLGWRQSFLFRKLDDPLAVSGPYALVRHPQFLSAIGITFFGVRLFNPGAYSFWSYGSLDLNWGLFTLALWVLSLLEDRELATHFGEQYREYAARVPRLLPN